MSFITSTSELRKGYEEMVTGMLTLNAKIDEKLRHLEKSQKVYDTSLDKVREDAAKREHWIKLDVGGQMFASTKNNFLRWEGTYFYSLVQGGFWDLDTGRVHCIDRDPAFFDRIMASFRTGKPVDFNGLSAKDAMFLCEELDYYQN